MLLNSLEIQQFRTFEYLRIKKFGQINLIVGRNNVGKSTILEAIRLYANLGAPHVLLDILDSRDDRFDRDSDLRMPVSKEGPAIHHLFHGYPPLRKIIDPVRIGPFNAPDSTLGIGIEWLQPQSGDGGEERLVAAENPDFSEEFELTPALILKLGGSTRTFRLDRDFSYHVRRWQYQPRSFLELATPCVCVGPNGLNINEQEWMWESIALSDLEQDVIDSLNIIYPGVDAVAILANSKTGKPSVRVKHPTFSHPHPLKSLGDGTSRLFGLTLAMATAKGGLLLIDEIENGIHYSALPAVWRFIAKVVKRLDIQVFATSHSLDCIKAFHEVAFADQAIDGVLNRIEIKKDGAQSVLFDEQRLDRFLEERIEMR